MYQLRHDGDKKSKRKAQAKFGSRTPYTSPEKPGEELYECVTCGFKVQKIKFN